MPPNGRRNASSESCPAHESGETVRRRDGETAVKSPARKPGENGWALPDLPALSVLYDWPEQYAPNKTNKTNKTYTTYTTYMNENIITRKSNKTNKMK